MTLYKTKSSIVDKKKKKKKKKKKIKKKKSTNINTQNLERDGVTTPYKL